MKKLRSPILNHIRQERSESARERRIAQYRSQQQHQQLEAQEQCESGGGRLGSPSVIVRKVSVEVKRQQSSGAVCESRGGRPGLPVPHKPTVPADVKQHSTKLKRQQ